jgi:hypothetical protein
MAGKMPDGEIIDDKTRADGLARIIPMLKHSAMAVQKTIGNDWLKAHPTNSYTIDLNEQFAFVVEGEKILQELS